MGEILFSRRKRIKDNAMNENADPMPDMSAMGLRPILNIHKNVTACEIRRTDEMKIFIINESLPIVFSPFILDIISTE
mgnify:CR=1 FL=1